MTETSYHNHMHRLYRVVRGQVARDLSPLSPLFADILRVAFSAQVIRLQLRLPGEARVET